MPDGRLTVALITRDRRDRLLRTLSTLAALPEQPAVIVVDNGSADGTAAATWWDPGALAHAVRLLDTRPRLAAVGALKWWSPAARRTR